MTADNPLIVYDLKDLLADIKREQSVGFASLERAISEKAAKTDLAQIEGEIRGHGDKLRALEKIRDSEKATTEARARLRERQMHYRQWAIPAGLTALYTVVFVLQAARVI
jgi:hypothetical protein